MFFCVYALKLQSGFFWDKIWLFWWRQADNPTAQWCWVQRQICGRDVGVNSVLYYVTEKASTLHLQFLSADFRQT